MPGRAECEPEDLNAREHRLERQCLAANRARASKHQGVGANTLTWGGCSPGGFKHKPPEQDPPYWKLSINVIAFVYIN